MAFGKKTDRAGLQAVLELKNVDYSKDPEIQQLYTRLVNGRSQFGQILAKNASASLQIAEVVDALKDYNSKMESVSQEIAQASEDATKSASESSRVAGEVSNQHEELTNTILSASEESAAIYKNIEEGQQELTAIRDLSDKTISESSTMKQNMEKLFDIISNMNEVIEGINSISSQTNLLALNASIEAARAGEAGKGFSVVAEQIRKLSTETKDSSGQISEALSRLDEISGKMTSSIEETLKLIQATLEKVTQTGENVNKITQDSSLLGEHIQTIDSAMKEVESSNRQLVENMEQVSSIVETMTTCISDSDETSKRMLSKYEESASNINNIENVIQELMCELGIGGFMGLDDIHAGMKAKVILPKHLERMEYHGEVRSVAENSISLILSDDPQLNGSETCKVQVTVDNVLYCWDQAQIQADTASGSHAYALQLSTRPEIKNRRKYPRADVSNPCTITLKDSDTTFSGQLDNISANGFAFLIRDPFFMDHKHADVAIDIQNFALSDQSHLEGHVIRCSDDEGVYIVGCQMPEDNYAIRNYVDSLLGQ